MSEEEEYELFDSVREHGFEDIAQKLKRVLDKRDVQLDDLHSDMAQCRSNLSDKIDEMSHIVNANTQQITDIHVALKEHMKKEEEHYENEALANEQRYHKFFDAFPNRDARGHHDAHIELIDKEIEREELKKRVISHIITIITTAILVFTSAAVWDYTVNKAKDHEHPKSDIRNR